MSVCVCNHGFASMPHSQQLLYLQLHWQQINEISWLSHLETPLWMAPKNKQCLYDGTCSQADEWAKLGAKLGHTIFKYEKL